MKMKNSNLSGKSVLIFVFFCVVLFLFDGAGQDGVVQTILGMASFNYGVIFAFFMASSNSRYKSIISGLKREDSVMLIVDSYATLFRKDVRKKLRTKMDTYLVSSLDYKLSEFNLSRSKYLELFRMALSIECKTRKESEAHKGIMSQLTYGLQIRKDVESLVRANLTSFEWSILLLLLFIILVCLFYLNAGTMIVDIVIAVISTTSIIMLLVLQSLDSLKRQEQFRIWDSLQENFVEFGLLPYYPANAIIDGRVNPIEGKVRIAFYPNDYPDMTDKRIIEINIDKEGKYKKSIKKLQRVFES